MIEDQGAKEIPKEWLNRLRERRRLRKSCFDAIRTQNIVHYYVQNM